MAFPQHKSLKKEAGPLIIFEAGKVDNLARQSLLVIDVAFILFAQLTGWRKSSVRREVNSHVEILQL